jgi:hypothetical protein
MSFPRDDDMSLDRRLEIFFESGIEACLDVTAQRLADLDLFACRCELHVCNHPFPPGLGRP